MRPQLGPPSSPRLAATTAADVDATAPGRATAADMSVRLGTGKSGMSWVAEEALQTVLGVEVGCVTPLALANASASHVALLLDSRLRDCGSFFVHPILNTSSVRLDARGLEAFLRQGWLVGSAQR